jgi:simple sugar transport system ATP-binding protein
MLAHPPVLAIAGISKSFDALPALDAVSLTVEQGQIHALLGENGAGKSTLCNLIFGIHQPNSGAMSLAGETYRPTGPAHALKSGVAMVHQHFSLIGTMSVVENLMLGRVRGRLFRKPFAERIAALSHQFGLAIDPHRRIDDLSVGERQRVEIVKCLMHKPRLLILDEPTAVLPPTEIDALLKICRQVADSGCAVVLVTHKLAEIAQVADWVTVLRGGKVADGAPMAGNPMSRFVRAMIGRDAAPSGSENLAGPAPQKRPGYRRSAKNALTVDAVSYEDRDGVMRLSDITIEVGRGEIVGVAGVEGNGQSELGALLAGMQTPSSGRVFVDDIEITGATPAAVTAAGVGVVPEDRHAVGCILGMSVADNLFLGQFNRFSRFGLLRRNAIAQAATALMQRYDVRASGVGALMSTLSGGNQQKAVLAREMSLDPLVFLLAAQPTRGLDIGAVAAVYQRLREARDRGVGVLLISSELDELISNADRILVIFRGRIVGERPASVAAREAIGRLMAGESNAERPS